MKPGWKTTEFWMTLLSTIAMMAVAFGLVQKDEADSIVKALAALISAVLPLLGYNVSRGLAKFNESGEDE